MGKSASMSAAPRKRSPLGTFSSEFWRLLLVGLVATAILLRDDRIFLLQGERIMVQAFTPTTTGTSTYYCNTEKAAAATAELSHRNGNVRTSPLTLCSYQKGESDTVPEDLHDNNNSDATNDDPSSSPSLLGLLSCPVSKPFPRYRIDLTRHLRFIVSRF